MSDETKNDLTENSPEIQRQKHGASRFNLLQWLKQHEHLAGWIQTIAVIATLIFASIQLRDTKIALEATQKANEISLKGRVSDIIVRINEAAMDNPDISGEVTKLQRLHLMRMEYFFQTYGLFSEGFIDEKRLSAEENYLKWAVSQPEFMKTWKVFGDQYPKFFIEWVCSTIAEYDEYPCN